MRVPLIGPVAAAMAAFLAAAPARSQDSGPFVVLADFGNAADAGVAREELERELNVFRDEVRREERRGLPRFGSFLVQPASGLGRNPRAAWKPDTIAMLMGRVYRSPSSPVLRPRATLYIGPLQVQPMLRRPANSFQTLDAIVALTGNRDTDVGTYANYIGYAILLRTWARQPTRAAAIASVLDRRIDRDFGGPNRSSTCLDDLREAVKLIGRLIRARRGPRVDNIPDVISIDCNPRR
jgi:hypothetical protein